VGVSTAHFGKCLKDSLTSKTFSVLCIIFHHTLQFWLLSGNSHFRFQILDKIMDLPSL